jgi:Glycosyl transferases group 1
MSPPGAAGDQPTFVHFYPFRPNWKDGGGLRLATAIRATRKIGTTNVAWFDEKAGEWTDLSETFAEHADATANSSASRIKRAIFPHTLFESGRRAIAALEQRALFELDSGAIPVLHTSYLAPLLGALPPRSVVVDLYDLVWRAHQVEASRSILYGPLRYAYAKSVKVRESRWLNRARALPVAGWSDQQLVSCLNGASAWCPTGVLTEAVAPRPPDGRLRIGFLGSFYHQATLDSAVAKAQAVDVVLGGWGSDQRPELRKGGALTTGPVKRVEDFWATVDVAVIPVESGTGMKCKIAEALVAGKAVVTTPMGAAGFDPAIRRALTVVDNVTNLDEAVCRAARPAARDVTAKLGTAGAAATYHDFLVRAVLNR